MIKIFASVLDNTDFIANDVRYDYTLEEFLLTIESIVAEPEEFPILSSIISYLDNKISDVPKILISHKSLLEYVKESYEMSPLFIKLKVVMNQLFWRIEWELPEELKDLQLYDVVDSDILTMKGAKINSITDPLLDELIIPIFYMHFEFLVMRRMWIADDRAPDGEGIILHYDLILVNKDRDPEAFKFLRPNFPFHAPLY